MWAVVFLIFEAHLAVDLVFEFVGTSSLAKLAFGFATARFISSWLLHVCMLTCVCNTA